LLESKQALSEQKVACLDLDQLYWDFSVLLSLLALQRSCSDQLQAIVFENDEK